MPTILLRIMKQADQQNRRVVACGLAPSRNRSCFSASKINEKCKRNFISKESFDSTATKVKNVQLVRNTERPLSKARSVVSFTPGLRTKSECYADLDKPAAESTNSGSEKSYDLKLDVPDLCTSLRIANKLLEQATAEKEPVGKDYSDNLGSLKISKSKVLQKVNIPFEKQIYRDLVDLRVADDDLLFSDDKKIKSKNFEPRVKDKEPELSAFYKPSFDQEFILKVDKLKIEPDSLIHYDGFCISDRIKEWENT